MPLEYWNSGMINRSYINSFTFYKVDFSKENDTCTAYLIGLSENQNENNTLCMKVFYKLQSSLQRPENSIIIMIMIPNCTWWFLKDLTTHKLTKAKHSLVQIQICQGKRLLQNIIHSEKILKEINVDIDCKHFLNI